MKKITLLIFMLVSVFGFAQFPAPYCGPITFTSNVEPITLVNFAGINNSTDATVGAINPAHEDFTAIVGNVSVGSTYPITLKGNTDGASYTTKLRVYIDWNKNNDFTDAGESYDIGDITGSTGTDAIQLVGTIAVPATALAGNTRMRVIKKFNSFATSCQAGAGYGQAEDYTLSVTIPSCIPPSALLSSSLTSSSATISWTAPSVVPSQGYDYYYTTSSTAPISSTVPSGSVAAGITTVSLSSLAPASVYYCYVRAKCSTTSFSDWSGLLSINTTQLPGCATLTYPADGAIGVPLGDVTFTWDAPTTGDPATSYDLYGSDTLPLTSADFVGNYTTTSALITLSGYSTTFYWTVVPINTAGDADCLGSPFSFTTEDAPPAPTNDDCANATPITTLPYSLTQNDAVGSTNNDGFITGCPDGMNDGVWYTVVGDGGDITITASPTDTVFDPQLGIYTGTCGTFTCEGTADDGYEGDPETYTIAGSVLGTTYYINIGNYSGFTDNSEGNFDIEVTTTLAIDTFGSNKFSSYPNPVKDILNVSNSTAISKVQVLNLLGQEMIVKSMNETQGQVDMSQLAAGTYLVKLTSDNQVKTIKVVKE